MPEDAHVDGADTYSTPSVDVSAGETAQGVAASALMGLATSPLPTSSLSPAEPLGGGTEAADEEPESLEGQALVDAVLAGRSCKKALEAFLQNTTERRDELNLVQLNTLLVTSGRELDSQMLCLVRAMAYEYQSEAEDILQDGAHFRALSRALSSPSVGLRQAAFSVLLAIGHHVKQPSTQLLILKRSVDILDAMDVGRAMPSRHSNLALQLVVSVYKAQLRLRRNNGHGVPSGSAKQKDRGSKWLSAFTWCSREAGL